MPKFWRAALIFGILIALFITINLGYFALYGKFPSFFKNLARKSYNFWRFNVFSYDAWQVADKFNVEENLSTTQLPVFNLYADPLDIKSINSRLPKRKQPAVYNFKYIPAELLAEGHRYNIQLSYRGNGWWHWYGPKKSLRLKFQDDDYYLGIKTLNLNNPKNILPFLQTLSYQLAASFGILSPRSFLVHVRLNGSYYGIMEAFEQPNRNFLQKKNRVIGDIYGETELFYKLWYEPDKDAWQKYSTAEGVSETDFSNLKKLIAVLNENDSKTFPHKIKDIFEIDKFLKFYAFDHIISSYHNYNINIRIYCDPRTKKIEFILWDPLPLRLRLAYAFEEPYIDDTSIDTCGNLVAKKILSVPQFQSQKNVILWDMVKDDNLYLTICRLADQYDIISREDLLCDGNRGWQDNKFYRFSEKAYEKSLDNFKKSIYAKVRKIRDLLQDMEICAYFHEDKVFSLEEENLSRIFLSVRLNGTAGCKLDYFYIPFSLIKEGPPPSDLKIDIFIKDGEDEIEKEVMAEIDNENGRLKIPLDYTIFPTLKEKCTDIKHDIYEIEPHPRTCYLELKLKDNTFDFYNVWQWLKDKNDALSFHNIVTGQSFSASIRNFDASDFISGDLRNIIIGHNIKKESLDLEAPSKELCWEGNVNLTDDTIIKKDEVLYIRPGTKIMLAPGINLIVKGKILACGSPDAQINFGSLESDKNWGSVAVDTSSSSNVFSYCVFNNGHMAKQNMYNGALYILNSNVIIDNCEFYDNSGEDALNCQDSQVIISNCKFNRNAGDAIDLDSCQGEIKSSHFEDNLGDAIDISCSYVLIKDNTIFSSGDKGISLGEDSFSEITDNLIKDNLIGVAVKDQSKAIIYRCNIIENKTGLALYQKKKSFGGGRVLVCSSKVSGNELDLKCDEKSGLKLLNPIR